MWYWLRMWQPIETAPKDGRFVLVYLSGREGDCPMTAYWDDRGHGWTDNARGTLTNLEATHWQPLPEPPA